MFYTVKSKGTLPYTSKFLCFSLFSCFYSVVPIADGTIVGMASFMKTDYYPLPEIYPWISTTFVSEEYRRHRISQRLIDFANDYAKACGFEVTYIPSEHVRLYEKFGYSYVKDIVNYGNGVDRLYFKRI